MFACVATVAMTASAALEIPKSEQPPVIDGVSAEGEWDGALRLSDPYLHLGIFKATGEIDPRRCDFSVLWDETALYFRCRAETAPGNRLMLASGVHSVYMDDNFEFHFDPPASFRSVESRRFGVFQLIVNAVGETYTQHENPGYGLPAAPWKLKGMRIANKVQGDVWTLELAIPAKDLGGERLTPGEWGFIFTRNYRAGGFAGSTLPAYAGGGYEKPESYARMRLVEKARTGEKVASGFVRPKADVDWGDLSACVNPAELGGKEIDGFLKWYPSLNSFTLDLKVAERRLNEALTLKLDGIADYPVKADACRIHRIVPAGRTLPDGDYRLSLTDAKGDIVLKRSFRVKGYPWMHANKGNEQVLLPGFTAPRAEGASVSCVLRRYDLGENGFPRDIVAKDSSLLAAPVAVWGEKDGRRTDLGLGNRLAVERPNDLAVTWRSEGPAYVLQGRLEQDGLIRYDLGFTRPPDVERVVLELCLRAEHSILFHACGEGARTNPAGFVPKGEGVVFRSSSIPQNNSENFIPYCWVGADERGVAFAADTDEGWLHDAMGERDAIEILRNPNGDVTLRVNLVNGRLDASDMRRITFALQASPVKPRPKGWRGWSDGFDYAGTVNANGAWSPSQWGCFSDWAGRYPAFEDWSYVRKMAQMARDGLSDRTYYTNWVERVAKADAATAPWLANMSDAERRDYAARAVKLTHERAQQLVGKGCPILYPYTCNRELTKALSENAVMKDEWEESESAVVSGSYREYALYYLDKMIENGLGGVYNDNTYFFCNFSWATGDAWIDAKGKVHPSYGLWNSREYHRRQATLFVRHGRFPWITAHHTNGNILPTLGFVANTMGMEWKYGTDDFQNRFTPDYIRAVCQGGQGGFYPTVLDGILKIAGRDERRRVSRTMLAALLPHEVRPTIPRQSDRGEVANVLQKLVDWGVGEPDCEYAAYYDAERPVSVSDTNVLVSVYRRGDRYLAVCGSWTTNDVSLSLALRNGRPIRSATDVETGVRHDVRGASVTFRLKGHDFAMVELDCGPDRALYVDNVRGDDANDGSAARPFRSVGKGLESLCPGGTLRLVPNAEPYREGVLIGARHSGRPGAPTVIDGGGATIDGFVCTAEWKDEGDGVYSTFLFNNAWPMNKDGHWCGAFPLVRFGDEPGENVMSREELRPGCYFLKKMTGAPDHDRLYVKLHPGKRPQDLPVWTMAYRHNVELSHCANVRVRNFTVRNQPWDCFSVNCATNCVLENLDGGYAMDQGISSHSCVGIKVRKSRFHHNTGCGICDVNVPKHPFCSVSYDGCTIDHNIYRRPVEFYGSIPGKDAIPDAAGDYRMYNCRIFANDLSHADGRVIHHDEAARITLIECEVQKAGECKGNDHVE